MDIRIPYRLTDRETELVIRKLEEAEENHCTWLRHLHSSLICGKGFAADVFDKDAHHLCRFGRWYYEDAPVMLRDHPNFVALEEIHRKMHDCARFVANKASDGGKITSDEYDRFISRQRMLARSLARLRDELRELHFSFDPLTGAMNRRAFGLVLAQAMARTDRSKEPCCLSMVDIDHFKSVNDRYGHLAGDKVLTAVASGLTAGLRPYDSICRYGGEEFLLCLPQTTVNQALDILGRLRTEVEQTFVPLDHDVLRVTASFGVSVLDPDESIDTNLERADEALYLAKENGRNQVRVWSRPAA